MEKNLLTLKWEDHHIEFTRAFGMLYESNSFVDCTLVAEDQCLKAHQAVLASCSPYFQLLFSQANHEHPIVILKDVKFRYLKVVLDYVYKGEIFISRDDYRNFLEVANSLKIKGLMDENKENQLERGQYGYLGKPQRDVTSPSSEDCEVPNGNFVRIKECEGRNVNTIGKTVGQSDGIGNQIKIYQSMEKGNMSRFEQKGETHTAEVFGLPGVVEETSDEIIVKEEIEIQETENSVVCGENHMKSRVLENSKIICGTGPDDFVPDTHRSSVKEFSVESFCVSNGSTKNVIYANATNLSAKNELMVSSEGNAPLNNEAVIKNVSLNNSYLKLMYKPLGNDDTSDNEDNWMLNEEEKRNIFEPLVDGNLDVNKISLHPVNMESLHEGNMEPTQDIKNVDINRDKEHEGLTTKTNRLQNVLKMTEPVFETSVHQSIQRTPEEENNMKQFENRNMTTPTESCILPGFESELSNKVNLRRKREHEKNDFQSETDSMISKRLRANKDVDSHGNVLCSVPNSLLAFENGSSGVSTNVEKEASSVNTSASNCESVILMEHSIEIKNEPISESLENQDSDYDFVEADFHQEKMEETAEELTIREPVLKKIHQQSRMDYINNETSEEGMRTSTIGQPFCLEKSSCDSFHSDTAADAVVTSESLLMKGLTTEYNCPVCHKVFPDIAAMKDHMQQHKGKRTVKVYKNITPVCPPLDKFLNGITTMKPTSLHPENTHYKCPKCDYSTTRPWDIKIHWRIHGGERSFKCSQCKYAATTSSCLVRHMRVHTAERHLKCSVCDFEAVQRCGLVKHMLTHKKPFECSLCDFSATNKNWLTRHMRTHHGKGFADDLNKISDPPVMTS